MRKGEKLNHAPEPRSKGIETNGRIASMVVSRASIWIGGQAGTRESIVTGS